VKTTRGTSLGPYLKGDSTSCDPPGSLKCSVFQVKLVADGVPTGRAASRQAAITCQAGRRKISTT
jgi:hypothetical protein